MGKMRYHAFVQDASPSSWASLLEQALSLSEPLLVVLGPTASGKTDVSLNMAEFAAKKGKTIEILNADSRQLYMYMDIGTAKIQPQDMRGIRHHLLNVLDPKEEVTAAWYQEQANNVLQDVRARGSIPMLVGGSMLYISAVVDGLTFAPKVSEDIRKKLEEEYAKDNGATLYARLQEKDPESAEYVHPQNKHYLLRALEIVESTGMPASSFKKQVNTSESVVLFGVEREREEVYERINIRTKYLLEHGWVEEVQSLLQRGYTKEDPGMESHGYREIVAEIEKREGRSANIDRKKLYEQIAPHTRQYAKRQLTWWRPDSRIHWVKL